MADTEKLDVQENLFPPLSRAEVSKDSSAPLISTVTIREATPADVEWLVHEAKEFSKFNGTQYPLFDDEKQVRADLLGLIAQHFVRLAVRGDERMGFIAGYYVRHPLNPKLVTLCEIMWWVAEPYRRSRAGLMLLDAYVDWGIDNANWITFSLQTHSPVKPETLEKRGFHLHEFGYLREVL